MIEPDDYKFIADNVGGARSDADKAFKEILAMRDNLDASEVASTEPNKVSLRNSINATYFLIFNKYFQPRPALTDFMFALQQHITNFYGSVNEFLNENKVQVPQEFADLSAGVGFPIDLENII